MPVPLKPRKRVNPLTSSLTALDFKSSWGVALQRPKKRVQKPEKSIVAKQQAHRAKRE